MGKRTKSLWAILAALFVCLAIPVSAFATDKLVVKDGDGTTTFKVEDDGSLAASGNVAFGATSSTVPLLVQTSATGHVATFFRKDGNTAEIQIGQSTETNKAAVIGFSQDGAYYYMSVYGLGVNRLVFNSSGYLGVGTTTPSYPLEMASGAHVTTGGVWTNASSREYKKDIKELTRDEAMHTLKRLNPVKFSYKVDSEDRHVGFIAEDAPDLVATKDRKGMSPMDVVAVLTKVVQEQQKTINELSKKVAQLQGVSE
ncbi:MAG: tail fiber domain-containing protein [Desulfobacteraceae bacterium]|nr:tail fiber domain-containing protein [Desulfobacteraceae bacterium]